MTCKVFRWAVVCLVSGVVGAAPVRVAPMPNDGAVPDAEIGKDGTIHVAYVTGEDVFYVASRDGGKNFSAPLRVNSEPGTAHPANMFRGPDVGIGKDGRVHVIWYVNAYQRKLPQDQWGVFYAHREGGQKEFSKAVNLNHKPSDNYSRRGREREYRGDLDGWGHFREHVKRQRRNIFKSGRDCRN